MKQFLLLTLLLAFTASAFEFTGKVVGVADGDTITVLYGKKEYKIRFQHIDCPESSQAFGTKAKQVLSNKVYGKTVTVRWKEKDRYKRILGDVYVGQRWINVEMVNEGMAWHYKFFSKDASIAAVETKARAAKRGIWSQPNPVPPWEFRRKKSSASKAPPQKGTATERHSHHKGLHHGKRQEVSPRKLQFIVQVAVYHLPSKSQGSWVHAVQDV